jgi:acyl transferase domain-containing protein/NAD(P)-dependent dehydrogenase (short-subunit alcohol dehydrogenase family)
MESTSHKAIAIVGVGAVLPDAPNVAAFWENVKKGRYSITDVSADRWDPALYYDADSSAPDKAYSKIGGWVREFAWEPLKWHLAIPPRVVDAMDEAQKWAIACTREALEDYGYPKRPLDLDRTAVIFGNAMAGEKHYLTSLRIFFPEYDRELADGTTFRSLPEAVREAIREELHEHIAHHLPEVTEDSMPGELANCLAGRVANVFNFHGANFTTDAACASAMAAITAAVDGLVEEHFDAAITGGIDRNMGAPTFVKFCKIGALSATGTRPYAEGADGFVMGEGAAIFLLKRLADAERDGDKIYAVLRGIGASSDGKGKGITAPNPIGQKFAIERAWEDAGLSPATATLIEGHGTSTRVGDVVEVESMAGVLEKFHLPAGSVALGSVKSNIGHLKGAAGAAGVLKTALALHEKVLPPSAHFERPNPDIDFAHCPLYVNTELRPWNVPDGQPRRAGVSAFGFGGTNFHMVLEEYIPHMLTGNGKRSIAIGEPARTSPNLQPVPAGQEVGPTAGKPPLRGALVLGAATPAALVERLREIESAAKAGRAPAPTPPAESDLHAPERLAIDYGDAAELADKAGKALKAFAAGQPAAWKALRAQGIFRGCGPTPKVAFLYTGQGSQYVNMLEWLRANEPIVAGTFREADRVMTPLLGKPLSEFIFVDGANGSAIAKAEDDLRQTAITQPAVLAVDLALTRLFCAYGIVPDMTMGHSLGEYGALVAAGALPFEDALEAVSARGREMTRVAMADNGRMAAVFAPLDEIERIVKTVDGYVVIANINSHRQAVIGGATRAVEQAIGLFEKAGYNAVPLPVSHAFHTSIVAPAAEPLRRMLARLRLTAPRLPVVANVSGKFYPMGPDVVPQMLNILGRQIASAVQFVEGLRTLYAAGARVYVEVGPKKALQGFAEDVLGDDPEVVSLFTNHPKQGDLVAFNQALCGLYAAGVGQASRAVQEQPADAAKDRPGGPSQPVVITGAALGLPGTERIFDDANLTRILHGDQFIDVIPTRLRRAMLDKHVTRLVKSDNGNASFETLTNVGEMIKLAGRGGAFDLEREFGVPAERLAALDRVTQLAIGAGIDALRDAGIPLVLRYKTTSKGTKLPDRWMLPEAMRDETGVVFASAFPGYGSYADEMKRYYLDRARREQVLMLENLASRITGSNANPVLSQEIEWQITELRAAIEQEPYVFDRRFLFRILAMGHSQFAEFIGARGPNTAINAACASTAQAVSVAEDWIRAGRCRRVIIISADDVTSDQLMEWLGAGFLATGAAATDDVVEEAALPFDRRRHGMICGMGAAALLVESPDAARERGIAPICEVLSAVAANSAFHGTRLDVEHIGQVMEELVAQAEKRFAISRHEIAPQMVFVSHETYTPARGGSASAEIHALRRVFGEAADQIVITNTKGFTGHAMAAGIEEVIAVKALETGCVPPVANFKEVDPELGPLNLSKGGLYPVKYALRLGAGFGSQIGMALLRLTRAEGAARPGPRSLGYAYRIADPEAWNAWLTRMARHPSAELEVVQRTLRVRDQGAAVPPMAVSTPQPARVEAPPVVAPPPAPITKAAVAVAPAPVPAVAVAPPSPPLPAAAPTLAGDPVKERILELVVEKTGYPKDMLDLDLDLEADLGIDTVKKAEMFAAIREIYNIPRDQNLKLSDFPTLARVIRFVYDRRPDLAAPPADTAKTVSTAPLPAAAPVITVAVPAVDSVKEKVLEIVAEKTGYPKDMLDLDLDLEADLGIDTVKKAEMFAAIREIYNIPREQNLKLSDFPTLNRTIQFVYERRPDLAARPAAVEPAPQQSAATVPEQPTERVISSDGAIDSIAEKVLEIVAEKTGYPKDMLDLDLDLEADLGIDTVKQAEMFASVRAAFGIPRDANLKLRDFPTLAHVIKFARDRQPQEAAAAAVQVAASAPAPPVALIDVVSQVPRRVPVPALRPPLAMCKPTGVTLGPGCRVVLMPDQGGVSTELASRLEGMGCEVLRMGAVTDVQHWVAAGPIHGVFWLPALDHEGDFQALDEAAWHEALERRLKSLYTLMRTLYEPGAFLVSATRLGGQQGYDDAGAVAPLGGAVTGFTKAYKWERPEAFVKAIDFEAARRPADIAQALIDETLRDPGAVEIGYKAGERWTIVLEERPAADGQPGLKLDKDTVFLVTGAAGSIVSAITTDLAAASGGTFYLLDLVPEPAQDDPDLKRFVSDREGLKRELFERLQTRGERATPAAIEKELAGLERAQAARTAIDAVRGTGGNVHYFSVNLTDAAAVTRAIEQVRERSGRIDVLLHAAGMERSHILADKDQREFDLIFDVKADGWFHLLRAIGDMPLGAAVAFSSIAGRFGNRGQTDYSSANDLLCKLISSFRTTRPATRGIAIDWTAWSGIGMASRGSIPKAMEQAGIEMLPPEAGIPIARRELTVGGTRGEVLIAKALGAILGEWDTAGGLDSTKVAGTGPMFGKVTGMSLANGLTIETTLDPRVEPFLHDHQIDGTPVLPGVMGLEGFAEAALALLPGWHVRSVENVDLAVPFKFYRDEPRTVTFHAQFHPAGDEIVADCRLTGSRTLPHHGGAGDLVTGQFRPEVTTHFTGRVRLAKQAPQAETRAAASELKGRLFEATNIYRVYFHGPAYQVLERVSTQDNRTVGLMAQGLPANHASGQRLAAAPRLIELCFQTAGLWQMLAEHRMGLPAHIDRVTVFRSPESAEGRRLYAVVTAHPHDGTFDAEVVDAAGNRFLEMTGYRTVAVPEPINLDPLLALELATA